MSKANILIVEDNKINQMLLSTNLTEAGYTVKIAITGEEGLEMVRANAFDVMLLDLVLPGISGYQVLTEMKADEDLHHIPVIVISAANEMEDIIRCIEIGAVDYLPKPFDPILLHARINASLVNKRLHDVQKAYAQELKERNEELNAFASTVAHDLKSPLTVIMGQAMLLRGFYKNRLDAQGQRFLNRIVQSSEKMKSIIEELLAFASLRHQKPPQEPLDMAAIVAEVMDRLIEMKQDYEATIILPPSWPVAIGYGPWIEEVLVNYVSNALKYGGRPPQITMGATPLDTGKIRFWIQDNGPGIPVDKQSELFIPFTRLDAERAEGTGLGLSIVKRIVNKLGGEVGLESEPNQGSTFWFTLPTDKDLSVDEDLSEDDNNDS